jgi:hypothetical protein
MIDEKELLKLAQEAYSLALASEKAGTEDELDNRTQRARAKCEEFVITAGRLGKVR